MKSKFLDLIVFSMKTICIEFKNEIKHWEIPLFRGAVIAAVGDNDEILFHNHKGDGFRYAYPLIQYKRIHGKAALVALGEGTETLGIFFSKDKLPMSIGNHSIDLEAENVRANQIRVQLWKTVFTYSLRKWLPLNKENLEVFTKTEGVMARCALLERTLKGNMLSFLKGCGIHIKDELHCTITQLSEPFNVRYKGVNMKGFDVTFRTNLSIPDYIGLGKGVSVGNGIVTRMRDKQLN